MNGYDREARSEARKQDWSEGKYDGRAERKPISPIINGTKVCQNCEETKPVEQYTVRRLRADGTQGYDNFCKLCRGAKTRANRLRTQFGFEDGEWEQVFEAQGRVCAICKREPKTIALATDHDHKTGETRGIICHRCNRLLGWVFDRAEVLDAAAAYLRDPPVPRILGRHVIGLKGRVTRKKRGRKKKPGPKPK